VTCAAERNVLRWLLQSAVAQATWGRMPILLACVRIRRAFAGRFRDPTWRLRLASGCEELLPDTPIALEEVPPFEEWVDQTLAVLGPLSGIVVRVYLVCNTAYSVAADEPRIDLCLLPWTRWTKHVILGRGRMLLDECMLACLAEVLPDCVDILTHDLAEEPRTRVHETVLRCCDRLAGKTGEEEAAFSGPINEWLSARRTWLTKTYMQEELELLRSAERYAQGSPLTLCPSLRQFAT